ncbi:putative ribose 1,5-bisphosphate isomerase [ANME-1 cluster archaeon GoMg1]|nr:putative ribose 1,5-bisphosphate isomerase [ANME-1 cluster archaeon GoMg1]
MTLKFAPVSESQITRAIVGEFAKEFENYAETDVIIVGGGPSGLIAGKELASAGVEVLIIERNNYLGGGFWLGGFLMNKLTVRSPAESILDELGVPYKKYNKGLYVADASHACSKLIAATCDAGAKILNMVALDDVVLHNEKVSGVVVNWSAVSALPKEIACVDPVSLESKLVIDATGHDASVVKKLEERGLLKIKGQGAMWVERSENLVVEHTSEFYPGLIVTGMAVSAAYGLPRMGPTFGAMLMSGKRAAEVTVEKLKR